MKIKFLLSIVTLFLCVACNLKEEYHHFNSIPLQGWNKCDTLSYHINGLGVNRPINISVNIRNTHEYSYENLILSVQHNLIDSTLTCTDTISLFLANSDGIWLGEGWGNLRQTSHQYTSIQKPQLTDSTYIKIAAIMPDTVLKGIEDIGIHITH